METLTGELQKKLLCGISGKLLASLLWFMLLKSTIQSTIKVYLDQMTKDLTSMDLHFDYEVEAHQDYPAGLVVSE